MTTYESSDLQRTSRFVSVDAQWAETAASNGWRRTFGQPIHLSRPESASALMSFRRQIILTTIREASDQREQVEGINPSRIRLSSWMPDCTILARREWTNEQWVQCQPPSSVVDYEWTEQTCPMRQTTLDAHNAVPVAFITDSREVACTS